jgi:hypothetical protein
VKEMEACVEERLGSLWKETLERPFSMVNVVRCETFVRMGSGARRNENMIDSE